VAEALAREVTVHGRVHGVFFRDSTRTAALDAGVTGWVSNEPDGTVRAHLEGAAQAVDLVLQFLRSGPPDASVREVDVREVEAEGMGTFEIR
jgi:acylphosphatase